MGQRIQPAVFGATGYSGFELVRLLARHDGVKKPLLFSRNGDSALQRLERGLSANCRATAAFRSRGSRGSG